MNLYQETPIIAPPGYKRGLILPAGQDMFTPLLRDQPGFTVIAQSDWPDYIAAGANISSFPWYNLNQRSDGSCASETVVNTLMIVRAQANLPRVLGNPLGIYGRVNGGRDQGSSLEANLSFIRKYGMFPEDVWPRSKGWQAKPSDAAYEAAYNYRLDEYFRVTNWNEFGTALLNGWVLQWGYRGHSITGCDLLNLEQFIYLNSWGNWGTKTKYSTLPYGFGVANKSIIMWGYNVYAHRTPIIEPQEVLLAGYEKQRLVEAEVAVAA